MRTTPFALALAIALALASGPALADPAPDASAQAGPTFGEPGSFDLATDREVARDESTGAPGALEQIAPDTFSPQAGLHAQKQAGLCCALPIFADNVCLGGLGQRVVNRSIGYGCFGSLVCGTLGCLGAVLPVLICDSQIMQFGEDNSVPVPTVAPLWVPAALLGSTPGCFGGACAGGAAGTASAILYPQDPVASQVEGDDGTADDGKRSKKKRKKSKRKKRRKSKKPKSTEKERKTQRDDKRGDDDARSGDRGRDDDADRGKTDRRPKKEGPRRPTQLDDDDDEREKATERKKRKKTRKKTRKKRRLDDDDDEEDEEDGRKDKSDDEDDKRPDSKRRR